MASYFSGVGNPGSYGGGGFGGLGDFGQSLYTGLSNAMPMLNNYYNFQDARAMDQDRMNANVAGLRASQYQNAVSGLENAGNQDEIIRLLNSQAGQQGYTQDSLSGRAPASAYYNPPAAPANTFGASQAGAVQNAGVATAPAGIVDQAFYQSLTNDPNMAATGSMYDGGTGLQMNGGGLYAAGAYNPGFRY
jgi:hypothetical protein